MKNKIIIFVVVFCLISLGIWFWGFNNQNSKQIKVTQNSEQINKNAPVILFYGKECPHCKDVEKFIENNNIKEKIKFEYLEIWHNKKNAEFFVKKAAEECGYSKDQLGVPFLYARGKCFSGTPDIVNFFKKEAGI
jgi:thioredoxin-related protein